VREGITVDANLGAAATTGDTRLVESPVANLVDNAMRHNVPGGRVTVSTSTTEGRTVLTVANTGPVVSASDVERLFQPFQRLTGERLQHDSGHGLGLTIVRAIASAHSAELTARARPEGGLDIEVSFTRTPSA
jgi:signal transduction histidine kinase